MERRVRRPANVLSPTQGLMVYMPQSPCVNCTCCHNIQSLQDWSISTPQRVTTYHGPDGHPNSPTCGHLKLPHPVIGLG